MKNQTEVKTDHVGVLDKIVDGHIDRTDIRDRHCKLLIDCKTVHRIQPKYKFNDSKRFDSPLGIAKMLNIIQLRYRAPVLILTNCRSRVRVTQTWVTKRGHSIKARRVGGRKMWRGSLGVEFYRELTTGV